MKLVSCAQDPTILFGELSRGSLTCGIIQLDDSNDCAKVNEVLQEVSAGNRNNLVSQQKLLQMKCPMLCKILTASDVNEQYLSSLIKDLLASMDAPFQQPMQDNSSYCKPTEANKD